jgi:hypothetical protein
MQLPTQFPTFQQTATAVETLPSPVLNEFAASGISSGLAKANIRWISGPEAVEEFLELTIAQRQKNDSYLTTGNTRLLNRYEFIELGGWIAYGVGIDGSPAEIPYLKPAAPRWDEERGRGVKYETPPGLEARPLLPAIEPGWAKIAARWGIKRNPGESCWQAILRHSEIPLIITEGFKKALALVELGFPAIALRGVTQWHPKGQRCLWPEIAALVKERKVAVAFDEDEKPRTRQAVGQQAQQLGTAIAVAEGQPCHLNWEGQLGKGIDDALVALPREDRGRWLAEKVEAALTPKEQRRQRAIANSKAILAQAEPDYQFYGAGPGYMGPLPHLTPGVIHWIAANMGSGKTVRIGADWARPLADAGGLSVVFAPLNSLGQQVAQSWGFPHIHDYGADADSQQALMMDIRASGGVVACPNSAPRIEQLIPQSCPLLVVIDEAGQTLADAANGGTLKDRYSNCWESVIRLLRRAIADGGSIALAEAGIQQDVIHLVQLVSGCDRTYGIRYQRSAPPWPVTLYRATPVSDFRCGILAAAALRPQVVVTTSQAEARRLERAARRMGIERVERIDSTTNEAGRYREFFENPDLWLATHCPQLLIISPSGKTGLSIEGGVDAADAYFEQVWGYFPSLDLDTHKQLLGRYRPAVPRQIWAPAYIQPDPGEKAYRWQIAGELDQQQARYAAAAGFAPAPPDRDDAALKEFLAARRQRAWASKIRAADALADALIASGHDVEVITTGVMKDREITELWDEVKGELAHEDAIYHAGLTIDPSIHTPSWASKIARSSDTSHEQRCLAAKVRMLTLFPGIDWDSMEIWYGAVFRPRDKDFKPAAAGARLWAEGDQVVQIWERDRIEAATILEKRLKAVHLLPQGGLRAAAAAAFKPLVAKLLALGKVEPGCPIAEEIKVLALRYAAELKRLWRIVIHADQSAVAVACKIARKFGLVLGRDSRIGGRGQQQWRYRIACDPLWTALVAARQQALGGSPETFNPPLNSSGLPQDSTQPHSPQSDAPPDAGPSPNP